MNECTSFPLGGVGGSLGQQVLNNFGVLRALVSQRIRFGFMETFEVTAGRDRDIPLRVAEFSRVLSTGTFTINYEPPEGAVRLRCRNKFSGMFFLFFLSRAENSLVGGSFRNVGGAFLTGPRCSPSSLIHSCGLHVVRRKKLGTDGISHFKEYV